MGVFGVLFVVMVILWQALLAGWVAEHKGRPFWLYALAGLVVGPLALLGALLLPRHHRLG